MVSILNCMIFCIVYNANCTYCELVYLIGTCIVQGFDMNYKNCWPQPWLLFGIPQSLRWSWKCIRFFFSFFFWLIQDFVLKFWNMHYFFFSFGWWYTLMTNKHQISLYLGLKKMANILQITFSNGSFKKYSLSFCLPVCPPICLSVSVCLSVCLSVCAFHTFFTMFPKWYHHDIFRSDHQ